MDFADASTVFKAQIIGGGKVLLNERPLDRQYTFMRVLKDYAKLNEERRPILDKLSNVGFAELMMSTMDQKKTYSPQSDGRLSKHRGS